MSIAENKSIATRFMQIWGNGNLNIIDELADPSISVYYPVFPQIINGNTMYKKIMESFRAAFPDSLLQIGEVIAENDTVVIEWTFSATHKGNIFDIPATNKSVKWSGITIYHIQDGKVIKEKGEEDFLGFLRQIGIVKQM